MFTIDQDHRCGLWTGVTSKWTMFKVDDGVKWTMLKSVKWTMFKKSGRCWSKVDDVITENGVKWTMFGVKWTMKKWTMIKVDDECEKVDDVGVKWTMLEE